MLSILYDHRTPLFREKAPPNGQIEHYAFLVKPVYNLGLQCTYTVCIESWILNYRDL